MFLRALLLPCFLLPASLLFPVLEAATTTVSSADSLENWTEGPTSGYPRLFTRKTASLLAEALHMLNRAQNLGERRWLETFVRRLATLADDLERGSGPGPRPPPDSDRSPPERDAVRPRRAEESPAVGHRALPRAFSPPGPNRSSSEGSGGSDRGAGLERELRSQPSGEQMRRMLETNETPKPKTNETPETPETDLNAKHRTDKLRNEKSKELERAKLLKNIFAEVQKLRQLGGKPQDVLDILKRGGGRTGEPVPGASHSEDDQRPAAAVPDSGPVARTPPPDKDTDDSARRPEEERPAPGASPAGQPRDRGAHEK